MIRPQMKDNWKDFGALGLYRVVVLIVRLLPFFFSDFSSTTIEGHSLMEVSPKKIRLAYSKNS